jgi:hypothetical protein
MKAAVSVDEGHSFNGVRVICKAPREGDAESLAVWSNLPLLEPGMRLKSQRERFCCGWFQTVKRWQDTFLLLFLPNKCYTDQPVLVHSVESFDGKVKSQSYGTWMREQPSV